MQKYRAGEDLYRICEQGLGKRVDGNPELYLVAEVDEQIAKLEREKAETFIAAPMSESQHLIDRKQLLELIATLKEERDKYLVALEDILRLTPPCYTWTSHDEKMRVIAQAAIEGKEAKDAD